MTTGKRRPEQEKEHGLVSVDAWRQPAQWDTDPYTGETLVWRPRLLWDTYRSWEDEWISPGDNDEMLTRLFVDPFHGIKIHDPAKTWFEPLDDEGRSSYRRRIFRMRAVVSGSLRSTCTARLSGQCCVQLNIGWHEWARAVLRDVADWYEFRQPLYIPPGQHFDGWLETTRTLAMALADKNEKANVRILLDVMEGRVAI